MPLGPANRSGGGAYAIKVSAGVEAAANGWPHMM
jgi:hypothetical protein